MSINFLLEVIVPISLSEDLAYWRSERPDEWTMDRFIAAAKVLEEKLTTTNNASVQCDNCEQLSDHNYCEDCMSRVMSFGR